MLNTSESVASTGSGSPSRSVYLQLRTRQLLQDDHDDASPSSGFLLQRQLNWKD